MLFDSPQLPCDVVERIRAFVHGPQIAAFIANYGERIPARVSFPHPQVKQVLCIKAIARKRISLPIFTEELYTNDPYHDTIELIWADGLRPRHRRFLWRLPKRAFRYLARGMPVLLDLGAQWLSPYTVIAVRHASLIVGTGTCEIEIPKTVIRKIRLYADVFDGEKSVTEPVNVDSVSDGEESDSEESDSEDSDTEPVIVDRSIGIEWHSRIGCAQNDAVEYDYHEEWLEAVQYDY